VDRLGLPQRQLVSVARVLLQKPRVVVFDEVTAPLTRAEVNRLFAIVRDMRASGVSVIYISHRLEEIFELTDRVTVLKNGAWVATRATSELDRRSLARLIIGKEPTERFTEAVPEAGRKAVLSVRGLSDELLDDVSFDLHAGEVLGLAGLAGAGRSNILETIFGERKPASGSVSLEGRAVALNHPADAIAHGIALVTEDRKRNGYVAEFPIWKSITLPWLNKFRRGGFLSLGRERAAARSAASRLDVRARSLHTRMRELSGGNQQKAILARWLSQPLRALLLDEPTHGVDIGAKEEIYGIVRDIAAEGIPVLIVSSELEELEGLCARVLLIVEGRIIGELTGSDIEKTKMLSALFAREMPASTGGGRAT
jgi:ABC-type sugar transport system ATPase subunit